MVIIFYDANSEKIYICTDREPMRSVDAGDENVLDHIPNDDILYVQRGHYITKSQFGDWLQGEMKMLNNVEEPEEVSRFTGMLDENFQKKKAINIGHSGAPSKEIPWSSEYIHPRHKGYILIQDLDHDRFPEGILRLTNKWHFIPLDPIKEELDSSSQYKSLLAKGKIEIVNAEYVKKNIHKMKQKISPTDRALDRILVQPGLRAEDVAEAGGVDGLGGPTAIPILVD